jgi:NDP-sugar pyrophosphorylase family protein
MQDVTAAILCGGLGTRLRPAVGDLPKVLADVGGRPFLTYVLDTVADAGMTRAVLCTGYAADAVEAAFGESYRGVEIRYSRETSSLGTGGALRACLASVETEWVMAMNGDSVCDASMRDFARRHRESGSEASILVVEVADARRFGRVEFDAEGTVTRFVEKSSVPGAAWVNGGVYLVRRRLLLDIPEGRPVSLEQEVLPSWVGGTLRAAVARGRLTDIGTPESYEEARRARGPASGEG